MVEVREAQRITEEEDRRVVADDVPIAFLGIELDGEAADVALGIGRAALARDRREADEQRRLLADLREDLRLGVAGDVVGDGKGAMGTPALGMHAPFGDHFAVEMRQLLDQPDVLQQRRTPWTRRLDVGVIDHGHAGGMGQGRPTVGHRNPPSGWGSLRNVHRMPDLQNVGLADTQSFNSGVQVPLAEDCCSCAIPAVGCCCISQLRPSHPNQRVPRSTKKCEDATVENFERRRVVAAVCVAGSWPHSA